MDLASPVPGHREIVSGCPYKLPVGVAASLLYLVRHIRFRWENEARRN